MEAVKNMDRRKIDMRDQQQCLQIDLENWKREIFQDIGVIGVQGMKELPKMIRNTVQIYMTYHIEETTYLIVLHGINKKQFKEIEAYIKTNVAKNVHVYGTYERNEPRPELMVEEIYHKIITNQTLKTRGSKGRELEEELKRGAYVMYLQPKYDYENNKVSGAEALVRYRSKEDVILTPSQFIGTLERQGLIYHIDIFMFENG